MNRTIIIGFVKEHEEICLHHPLSQELKRRSGCSFCHYVNRDSLLLLTRLPEARRTVDVGLALSPASRSAPYRPYSAAGFAFFHQNSSSESENIRSVFKQAFEKGYENVILMGHGTPNMPPAYLQEAIHALREGKGVVLSPMTNGRFCLIGMTRLHYAALKDERLLDELNFNERSRREEAIRKIGQSCAGCVVLPEWYAIKSIDDLYRLHTDSRNGRAWKARWTTCHVNDIILSEKL